MEGGDAELGRSGHLGNDLRNHTENREESNPVSCVFSAHTDGMSTVGVHLRTPILKENKRGFSKDPTVLIHNYVHRKQQPGSQRRAGRPGPSFYLPACCPSLTHISPFRLSTPPSRRARVASQMHIAIS